MPTTITLGRYFETWRRNHVQTEDQLAEYLGVTIDGLAALAEEPIELGDSPSGSEAGGARPMPAPPLSTELDPIIERTGVNGQRLRNVIYGRY